MELQVTANNFEQSDVGDSCGTLDGGSEAEGGEKELGSDRIGSVSRARQIYMGVCHCPGDSRRSWWQRCWVQYYLDR